MGFPRLRLWLARRALKSPARRKRLAAIQTLCRDRPAWAVDEFLALAHAGAAGCHDELERALLGLHADRPAEFWAGCCRSSNHLVQAVARQILCAHHPAVSLAIALKSPGDEETRRQTLSAAVAANPAESLAPLLAYVLANHRDERAVAGPLAALHAALPAVPADGRGLPGHKALPRFDVHTLRFLRESAAFRATRPGGGAENVCVALARGPYETRMAALALACLAPGDDGCAAVIEATNDPAFEGRLLAVEALSLFRPTLVAPALAALMRAADNAVRSAAVDALISLLTTGETGDDADVDGAVRVALDIWQDLWRSKGYDPKTFCDAMHPRIATREAWLPVIRVFLRVDPDSLAEHVAGLVRSDGALAWILDSFALVPDRPLALRALGELARRVVRWPFYDSAPAIFNRLRQLGWEPASPAEVMAEAAAAARPAVREPTRDGWHAFCRQWPAILGVVFRRLSDEDDAVRAEAARLLGDTPADMIPKVAAALRAAFDGADNRIAAGRTDANAARKAVDDHTLGYTLLDVLIALGRADAVVARVAAGPHWHNPSVVGRLIAAVPFTPETLPHVRTLVDALIAATPPNPPHDDLEPVLRWHPEKFSPAQLALLTRFAAHHTHTVTEMEDYEPNYGDGCYGYGDGSSNSRRVEVTRHESSAVPALAEKEIARRRAE